jgi:hypothetical protein
VDEELEVLVDSLDDEEEDEEELLDSVVVVGDGVSPRLTGGLIAGTAPPAAGHVSPRAVRPPPVSAESAQRRSHRRGAFIPTLTGPSLI